MTPNHGQTSSIEQQQFGADLQDAVNDQNSNECLLGQQQNQVGPPCSLPDCNFQRLCPISTVLIQTMGAKKKSIVFVTKQVICK